MVKIIIILVLVLYFSILYVKTDKCNEYFTKNNLQFINDYSIWRNITFLILLNEVCLDCNRNTVKTIVNYFSDNGRYVTTQFSNQIIENFTGKIGIIYFDTDKGHKNLTDPLFNSIYGLQKNTMENLMWLIISDDGENTINKLKFMAFGLNVDLVIAIVSLIPFKDCNVNESTPHDENLYRENMINFTSIIKSKKFINNKKMDNNQTLNVNKSYCLVQLYKIRKEISDSTFLYPLGTWSSKNSTKHLRRFLPIEKRTNFYQYPIIFGKKNSSQISSGSTVPDIVLEDEADQENLNEFLIYFVSYFNASEKVIYFQKLGYKDTDGEWNDLLQAVVNEEIDLGLHSVIKTPDKRIDMDFTHKIMESMRNIYIKPQESNELRDIFLIPFGKRLIFCVIGTGVIFSLVLALVNKVSCYVDNACEQKTTLGLGDTIIWCIGIFSMQGSFWEPRHISGNLIMIIALLFALLIYSSYSAFITSILSVELPNIKSVTDLLESDYKIGYTKNSPDEILLRSMNDSQLQQIYLRGYLGNTVNSIEEGLLKTTKGHYGFFASCSIARKEIQKINNFRCNYDILEIPVYKTNHIVAFPLSKASPYKKIINLSLLKMYETGIYKYIHNSIVPPLPECKKSKVFRSAQLSDLISAFGIFFIGIIVAVIFLILECVWYKKSNLVMNVKQTFCLKCKR